MHVEKFIFLNFYTNKRVKSKNVSVILKMYSKMTRP